MEIYQDVLVKGHVLKKGVRHCESRYQAIRQLCQRYKRPITVLDIGANLGYFTFKLAQEFPGTFVMIEGAKDEQNYLLNLCKLNNNHKVVLLPKRVNVNDLKELAATEHFDITLALSVIHHFAEPMDEVYRTMTTLGDYLVSEIPAPNEKACNQHRVNKEPLPLHEFKTELLSQTPTHTAQNVNRDLILTYCPPKTISKPYWGWEPHFSYYEPPTITSTHEEKHVRFKRKDDARTWIDGINFSTFIGLNGVYPPKHKIVGSLNRIDTTNLHDVRQWNMILSQGQLKPIDTKDPQAPDLTSDGEKQCLKTIIELYQKDQLKPNGLW